MGGRSADLYVEHMDLGGDPSPRRVGPREFRRTTAVHALEAGVAVIVIRGWLGHERLR